MEMDFNMFAIVGFASAGEPVHGQNPPPSSLNVPAPSCGTGIFNVPMMVLSLSSEYIRNASAICLSLFTQAAPVPDSLALLSAGNNSAAKIAMIAITTSNSISVNPGIRQAVNRRMDTSGMNIFILGDRRIQMAFFMRWLFHHSLSPEESALKTERSFYKTSESKVSSQQSNNPLLPCPNPVTTVASEKFRGRIWKSKSKRSSWHRRVPHNYKRLPLPQDPPRREIYAQRPPLRLSTVLYNRN